MVLATKIKKFSLLKEANCSILQLEEIWMKSQSQLMQFTQMGTLSWILTTCLERCRLTQLLLSSQEFCKKDL